MTSEGEHQAVAEDLQSAAKGVLEKPGATSEFIQNVAHIVLDKSNQAADSSKAYVQTVVHKVQDYAQNAVATGSSGAPHIQETLSKAVHVGGAAPGNNDSTAPSGGGLFTSVATWCSSLCGSKSNAAGETAPRNIDFRAAAENVAQVLHSSTAAAAATTTTTTTTSPVASGDAPVAEEPKSKE